LTRNLTSAFNAVLVRAGTARVVVLFVFHSVVFTVCYGLAWMLRFEFEIPAELYPQMRASVPFVVGVHLIVGALFSFYRGWWRYVGVADAIRLAKGATAALGILLVSWWLGSLFLVDLSAAAYGVLIINWSFVLLALCGARIAIHLGRSRIGPRQPKGTTRRVVIVGAGDAGEALAREIENHSYLGMRVVGFIDDHRAKWDSQIRGINVSGPISRIREITAELEASEALLAIPSASGPRMREIIQHLSSADIPFRTMPGIDQIVSGKVNVSQLRNVNVEDLIRREKIELPGEPVRALIEGSRVMIMGAGGTIGSELASQLARLDPSQLILVERSEHALYEVKNRLSREVSGTKLHISGRLIDIQDSAKMATLVANEKPQIVFLAAAHKHVPLGEENPAEYLNNNALAALRCAEICSSQGVARFIFISSDKAINPTSVMGATKRAAEILLLHHSRTTDMIVNIVRFGNVIGSSGSAVPLFLDQIAAGGPVTVTDPHVTRYFIRRSEAISLVLQAAAMGTAGQILMLDMGVPIRITDLARDLIRLSNHTEEEIRIVYTGLRPGEKMFEEIDLTGESVRPTIHPQIVIKEAPVPEPFRVSAWLQLAAAGLPHTLEETILLIQQLVPEYLPSNVSPRMPPIAPEPVRGDKASPALPVFAS
jgi:FlaA1/EpsC-like NDP-sugar epimerase